MLFNQVLYSRLLTKAIEKQKTVLDIMSYAMHCSPLGETRWVYFEYLSS